MKRHSGQAKRDPAMVPFKVNPEKFKPLDQVFGCWFNQND
jgi:hypothetical protein